MEALPGEDDAAAVRRELWVRTDEAYESAVETLAKKRSAATGQAAGEEEENVPDFSRDEPAKLTVPFPGGLPEPDQLLDVVARLSAIAREFPDVAVGRVTCTSATVRRRFVSS